MIHVDRCALSEARGRADPPIETVRRLSCDGSLVAIADGPNGAPLSVGRKQRTVSAAIKRALWARDGGCAFPCTHTRFVYAPQKGQSECNSVREVSPFIEIPNWIVRLVIA